MIKYRIQFNDGYFLFMGNTLHGKYPYITHKKDDATLFTLACVTKKAQELLQHIADNNLTALNVHIIPVEVD